MKKRVFLGMVDAVYCVTIFTEDWSEGDLDLMQQFGEPEINIGGTVTYEFEGESCTKTFGDVYIRILHGFPFVRRFDSRDYTSVDEAVVVGKAWKEIVLGRLDAAILAMREKKSPLPTEEVSDL